MLVVDDQHVNLSIIEKILSDLPLKVIKCSSGEEAIKIAEKENLALILMDVQMPGLDGFETVDEIKKIKRAQNIPIIFLTGVGTDTENVTKGYESGAVDYLIKPVSPFVLKSKVQIFLDMNEKFEEIDNELADLELENHALGGSLELLKHKGFVPICTWCGNIRNEEGEWEKVEVYIKRISDAELAKGVCPHCAEKLRGQMGKK